MPRLIILFLLLAVNGACTAQTSGPVCDDPLGCVHIGPGEPVTIALLQVLSGENAMIGVEQLRGVELALLERRETLLGHPLKLLPLDSHCSREGGATAALRVASEPQIAGVIGTSCSGAAVAAMEILHTAGITMISGSNTAASLTSSGNDPGQHYRPGYFRTALNDDIKGVAAAVFAVDALGSKRAATIDDGDPYTEGLTRAFASEFEARGGHVALVTTINKGDTDMLPLLTAILRSGVDLLFFPVFRPEGDAITLAAQSLIEPASLILMSADGLFSEPFIADMGDAVTDMHFVVPQTPQDTRYQQFRKRYHDIYGEWPAFTFHAHAHDAAELLLLALEATAQQHPNGSLTIGRQQLMDRVYTIRFEGLTGTIACDTFGDCGAQAVNVVQVADPKAGFLAANENVVFRYGR